MRNLTRPDVTLLSWTVFTRTGLHLWPYLDCAWLKNQLSFMGQKTAEEHLTEYYSGFIATAWLPLLTNSLFSIPATPALVERKSCLLKRTKTYLRSNEDQEMLSCLCLVLIKKALFQTGGRADFVIRTLRDSQQWIGQQISTSCNQISGETFSFHFL